MTRAVLRWHTPRPEAPLMRIAFATLHDRLINAIQGGRADDAYDYARLLAYLGPRL